MARGELIGCFGLTEEEGGSDPGGAMRTRARPDGDGGYVLSGSKMWITNGTLAGLAIVWAMTETDEGKQIRGFVVERGMEGFSTVQIHNKFSMRASDTSELALDEVRIPPSHVLPGARGIKAPLSCLTEARYGIAWGSLGAAMACYEEALAFTTDRSTFGSPIGGKQLVQEKLVWMLTEITKCQLLCWRLGRLKDEGKSTPAQVSMAKRDCVSMALRTARHARDILGASGITADFQAMRHMCNLESVYTYEGTHDIHTLIVGEDITGQRAF
jgi:glutaryl-CoA dehydrogenase